MAAGLIIWDEDGNQVLNLTTRVGRLLGSGATGTSNGSLTPAGSDTGTLFCMLQPTHMDYVSYGRPTLTVTDTTISWSWGTEATARRISYPFVYGVY